MKTYLPIDKSADRLLNQARHEIGGEFSLPYVMPDPGLPERPQVTNAKVKGKATILFVDDEAMVRKLANLYLEENGYRVIEARDGAHAISLWKEHQGNIDLVLTDVRMPGGLNGHQLIQHLRTDRPELKAILVSGYSSDFFGEEPFLDGATTFLEKPYHLDSLARTVHHSLYREKVA